MTGCTVSRYKQFETSETIEQELRPAVCEQRYYSRGDWWAVIYTACKSLAKMCRLFLGVSHFDLEGWQMYPPSYT